MLSIKRARSLVSNVLAVERLNELNTRFSLAHIVMKFLGVNTKPHGKVSKLPSSSNNGKLMIIAREFFSCSIRERSSASNELLSIS